MNGNWVDAGGICNYGCDAGNCNCSAPTRFIDPAGIQGFTSREVLDLVLQKSWHVYQGFGDLSAAKALCGNNARLPTLSEAKAKLIAQREPVTQCADEQNLATAFVKAIQANADPTTLMMPIWTSDISGSGDAFTIHVPSGKVSTRSPLQQAYVVVFCIDKP